MNLEDSEGNTYHEIPAKIDAKEFEKVVRSRRSIRLFEKTEEIPEVIMKQCLDLALLAPNSSNMQPWEYYWIRSDLARKKIVRACFGQPAAASAKEIIVCVARTDKWRVRQSEIIAHLKSLDPPPPPYAFEHYERIVPFVYSLGPINIFGWLKWIFFSFVGMFQPVVREPMSYCELTTWAVKSSALGCENLMLALRAYGYDSCPLEGFDSHRVKVAIGQNFSGVEVTMIIAAGKRAKGGVYGPQYRAVRENFVFEV